MSCGCRRQTLRDSWTHLVLTRQQTETFFRCQLKIKINLIIFKRGKLSGRFLKEGSVVFKMDGLIMGLYVIFK